MYLSDFKHINAFEQLLSACLPLCQVEEKKKKNGDVEAKGAAYSTNCCQLYKDPTAKGNLILQCVCLCWIRSTHKTGTLLTKTYRDKGWSHPSTVSLNSVIYCPTDTRNISEICSFILKLRIRWCTMFCEIMLERNNVRFFPPIYVSNLVWKQFRVSTYHLLIWQLSSLDAAALPHCLLVPFALGVTEQVYLGGDLQKHMDRRSVTGKQLQKESRWVRDTNIFNNNGVKLAIC